MGDSAASQTFIEGKLLSVDGTTIPETVISIDPEKDKDIFSDQYEDVSPKEDGSYQLKIQEPALYRLTFRGVFHHELRLPIMIYDQPSIKMNVLLMPKKFNDGLYFDQEDYLEWIRVVGNFNDYNFNTGKIFSLNSDGSISTFIPVNSDTLHYHVRGITYNQGVAALPQADEFNYREDVGFESVLYNNLPEDSLEIRYDPDDPKPFERHFPIGVDFFDVNIAGFISLESEENKNWIHPLSLLQPYLKVFSIVGWEMAEGIPVEAQIQLQQEYSGDLFNIDLSEEFEQVSRELNEENLHPQQQAILSMGYASILGWMAHKRMFLQMRNNQPIPELNPDNEILNLIPEIVSPVHPAWRYNNGSVAYLLTETDDPQKFINYFHDIVEYHPNDKAVRWIASSMIRHLGAGFSSVEEMPVYQLILDRYGENDLARDAHMAFRNRVEE